MPNLHDLYQDAILDHYRNPRNFHRVDQANRQADGANPLCGDKLSVYAEIENGVIRDIGFTGTGCAIFIASASMMTESVKGKTLAEAEALSECFHRLMEAAGSQPAATAMEQLSAFSGVRSYPARVKCAALPWSTLQAALKEKSGAAPTK